MADYQVVAQTTSLAGLKDVLTNIQLQPGDRVRVTMNLNAPVGWAFNAAGAELLFQPFMPESMNLIDVWGDGSMGYVEMEATSPPLVAVLGFIADNWLAIVIAGVVIAALVIMVTISIKVSQAIMEIPNWAIAGLVIGGVALLGVAVYKGVSSGKLQRR